MFLGGQCVCVFIHVTHLNFSASTTDRHCECTDDVVTEICLCFYCCVFSDNLSSVVIFWSDIPYQSAFSVKFFVFFLSLPFLCEVPPHMANPQYTVHYVQVHVHVCVCVPSLN